MTVFLDKSIIGNFNTGSVIDDAYLFINQLAPKVSVLLKHNPTNFAKLPETPHVKQ